MSECIEFTNLTPLYEITQKDILKILKERLYQVRKSDIKKSKRNSAKGGHVMWYRVGINQKGEEVPQGILLSSSSGTIAWKKQLANINKNDYGIIGVKKC
jgi:hypothetical protein